MITVRSFMLRITAYQREILDALETRGLDYLLPLVYGCGARFPDLGPKAVLARTVGSICGLMRIGMVDAFRESLDSRQPRHRLSANEVMGLLQAGAIKWNRGEERWKWNDRIGGRVRIGVQLPEWEAWHARE